MPEPFWAESPVRFACAKCSACCRHAPGFVFLSRDDIQGLLALLSIDFRAFLGKYVKTVDIGTGVALSLVEKPGYDCVFWGSGSCGVYTARPVQCRTYPFWSGIVDSQTAWISEGKDCPGIGMGDLIDPERIRACLWEYRSQPSLTVPYGTNLESLDENSLLGSTRIHSDPSDAGTAEKQDILDRSTHRGR